MATVVVGCMCVQNTKVEGTCIMKIQSKGDLLPEAILLTCYHGNRTNRVQICTKFDAHTHSHCQVINNNRYYPQLLTVAMATVVVYYT